jgi:Rrf2 family nitric oxide-sensitive transcriptional repressor
MCFCAIRLGEVVRHTEAGFALVDCAHCLIAPACGLTGILAEATRAFLAVLDRYTVDDLLDRPSDLRTLFAIAPPQVSGAGGQAPPG